MTIQAPSSTPAVVSAQRFGRALMREWPLDPKIHYLNHGTVGVTPIAVLAAHTAIRDRIESNPSLHLLREVVPMVGGEESGSQLRAAAVTVARFFGARADDLVFVDNDTTGINAVLQSFVLGPDDEVLAMDTTYGGVRQAVRHVCRRTGASAVAADHPCPIREPGEVLAAIDRAITPRTRLAVLDHIVSETGVVLPLREMVALVRERAPGVRVLVDGAHAPGQLALDIPSIGADWYAGNLHKWAFVPRSCGILWAAPEVQDGLHPTVVSWNLDQGFTAEFDWTGTRDPSSFLAAPAGLAFLERLPFAEARAYNHEVLWRGVALLMDRLARHAGGEPVPASAPESMSASMIAIRLPRAFGGDTAAAQRVRDRLLFEHAFEVQVITWRERLWMRISIQVYNELADLELLADALDELAKR
ncbi:MAG TPA: aminotransferase class V-fold PLP-dependent enzyme [Thermoanaerobaculia bacterium]|nr:aminotransferase class V-fold PLP-dependent enzyme [Thermoanaerobaculia bacterium]